MRTQDEDHRIRIHKPARDPEDLGRTPLEASGDLRDPGCVWIDQRGSEVVPLPECLRLLAVAAKKGAIGRLAVSQDQAPLVRPANFTYHDRNLVIRLGEGTICSAAVGALVAFEVDEVDHETGLAWSVLVRGLATLAPNSEPDVKSEEAPKPLVPDPGETLLAIRADVVTGRRFKLDS